MQQIAGCISQVVEGQANALGSQFSENLASILEHQSSMLSNMQQQRFREHYEYQLRSIEMSIVPST